MGLSPRFAAPFVVAVSALALLGTGCGGGVARSVPDDAVAVVGDQGIPKREFDSLLEQAARGARQRGHGAPKIGSPEYAQLRRQILGYLVQRAEYAQKADEMGVHVGEKQVAQRLRGLKQQYFHGNERRYREQLRSQGLTDLRVRDNLRAQLLSEGIYRRVTAGVTVPDEAVRDSYEKHRRQYLQPASREVRELLVKTRRMATRIRRRLVGGASFARLARRYSTRNGAVTLTGRLKVQRGQTVAAFDRAAFALATGKISGPVKTQVGFYLIQALSPVRRARPAPLSQVRGSIRSQLLQSRRTSAINRWSARTRQEFEGKVAYATGYAPSMETGP